MMIDTTIYGYVGDGFVLCPRCAEDEYGPQLPADLAQSPLFSHHDSGNGEWCECGETIFEPYFDLVWSSDDVSVDWASRGGVEDEVEGKTYFDPNTLEELPVRVEPLDSDYGYALGVYLDRQDPTHGLTKLVAIWATPDHPQVIAGVEVD